MDREILFRGKRAPKFGKGWSYGVPYTDHDGDCIIATDCYRHVVIKKTVGQFTGLTDKNGEKIFEGDIVSFDHPYNGKSTHEVIWDEYSWNLKNFYASCLDNPTDAFSEGTEYMKVIGNIHDNKQMLGRADMPVPDDVSQPILQPAIPRQF